MILRHDAQLTVHLVRPAAGSLRFHLEKLQSKLLTISFDNRRKPSRLVDKAAAVWMLQ